MKLVIIDYGLSNLRSVEFKLRKYNKEVIISSDKEQISKAKKLILAGVGHFGKAMNNLKDLDLFTLLDFKVVNEQKGTANRSKSKEYLFSGKTGTSQVKKITIEERESEDFKKRDIDWKNKDHALFVGYSPSEKPRYAISVTIEHGGSGALTAAPIAKRIFDYIYEQKI